MRGGAKGRGERKKKEKSSTSTIPEISNINCKKMKLLHYDQFCIDKEVDVLATHQTELMVVRG